MRFGCDLNVPMLLELRMVSESQFKTVGAAEAKRRAAVLVRDLGMSVNSSQQISVNGVACMTPMRLADA